MKVENVIVWLPGIFTIILGLMVAIPFIYIKETSQDLNDILDIYVTTMMFVGLITFFIGGFIILASGLLFIRIRKLEKKVGDLSYQIEELSKKNKD